jgi:hypothetical protein
VLGEELGLLGAITSPVANVGTGSGVSLGVAVASSAAAVTDVSGASGVVVSVLHEASVSPSAVTAATVRFFAEVVFIDCSLRADLRVFLRGLCGVSARERRKAQAGCEVAPRMMVKGWTPCAAARRSHTDVV